MKTIMSDKILLAHGGGGQLSSELIENLILPHLSNEILSQLGDSAILKTDLGTLCFTTDSYVVRPLFFKGGDIGKLSVCGTINDLAVAGARPVAMSLALIIEEGFSVETLERIMISISSTARANAVMIVTGDTKTVEAGAADGIFINTAGIGVPIDGAALGFGLIEPGDKILISGTIGDHGMAIMSQRQGLSFESSIESDCAAIIDLTSRLLVDSRGVKFMRDPTRGGLAATLNEISRQTGLSIEINQSSIPVNPAVGAAAEMLGFDLLNIANEGKFVAVISPGEAERCLDICRNHPLGRRAAILGQVLPGQGAPLVELITKVGGRRIVQMPYGRELPRIC